MKSILFSTILAFSMFLPHLANAESPCSTHENMKNFVIENYNQQLESVARTYTGQLIETFVNHKTTTWSVLVTAFADNGQKITCIVSSGNNYYRNFSTKPVEDEESGDPT